MGVAYLKSVDYYFFFSGEFEVSPWINIVFNCIKFYIEILSINLPFVNDVRVNYNS